MSFHTRSFLNSSLNSADHAWCCINSYLSVCSERRSRGDRYDSMVSAVHVFRLLLYVCSFLAVCRRCWWIIFQTRWLEFLFLSVVWAQRHGHCDAFSLCMHTDLGLLLPGNSCLLGYHRAAVVQRSTRRAKWTWAGTNAIPEQVSLRSWLQTNCFG